MFKFLRRYNKWILAVGGVLLMITFLIPQAFDRAGSLGSSRSSEATIGDDQSIPVRDRETAARELELIRRLNWQIPWLTPIRDPWHWYLLVHEAEQAGMVGTYRMGPDERATLAASRENPNFVEDTYAKYHGVVQMLAMYQTAARASDRRLQRFAERVGHRVDAQFVVIEAPDEIEDFQPYEADIAAQMNAYADKLPGEGERGFGYKFPDRVKLEWIRIDADAVREAVRAGDGFTSIAQRKHWRNNPDQKPFPPIDDKIDVPDVVREDLLEKLTQDQLREIEKFAANLIRQNLQGVPLKEGYYTLPEDWPQRRIKLDDVAQRLAQEFKIDLPAYKAIGDRWLSMEDVAELEGIGGSQTDKFGRSAALRELVASAREFSGSTSMQVQKDVVGPPMRDDDGNLYFFRVTDAEKSRSPTSVDEVRDAVVRDLARVRGYERLAADAAAIQEKAQQDGLLAVALDHDTIVQPRTQVYLASTDMLRFGRQFARPSQLPILGEHKPTIEAIIDRSRELTAAAATAPDGGAVSLADLPEEQRIMVLPVEDKLAVVVVKLLGQQPLTQESFAQLASSAGLMDLMAEEEAGEDEDADGSKGSTDDAADPFDLTAQQPGELDGVFGFESLAKRHNFIDLAEKRSEKNGKGEKAG